MHSSRGGAWLRPARLSQRSAIAQRQEGGASEGLGYPQETGHWLLGRGASAGRGRISLRPPGIGWWGGQGHVVRNRRGKRTLPLWALLPRRALRAGVGLGTGQGGVGVTLVCDQVRDPGHPSESGGGREVLDP